jgi:N-acetylneuraminate lyase
MIGTERFEGLVAAPFVPLDADGWLNEDSIPAYYEFLEKNGISGAFINGSTGEGPSLTQRDKRIVASRWAACLRSGGKVRVINLVGGTSYPECIENAIFSREEGLSAIAVLAPYYYKPESTGLLAEFVARIGENVPEMPVYFYHIPSLSGVNLPMSGFLSRISGMLENFRGIKYTHEDFMDFLVCLNYNNGAYDMLWGRDESLLSALVLGCRGAVGSTYNYAAPLYHALRDAFYRGDNELAVKLQKKSVDMIALLAKYGGIPTGKAFMKYIGLDCGPSRLPLGNMDSGTYKLFARDVRNLEMEEFFSKNK